MQLPKNMIIFLPAILAILGFLFLIPGSFIAGNTAYEAIKNYNPAFTNLLSDVKGDLNGDVRTLWITIGFVAAFIGLGSGLLTIKFPLSFGKALLLDCIIVAFAGIAFNIFMLFAFISFFAGGVLSLSQKRE